MAPDSSLKNIEDFRFNSKIKALCEFCFTGNHPSGFLFNREIVHKYDILEKCHAWEEKTRAFYTDFISTLLLRYGDAVYIDIACVYTVKPPFDGVKHSYTYSESKGNLFFTPLYKFQVFEEYISFLQKEYKIPYSNLFKFIKRALVNFLCYSNAGYLSI